MVSDIQELSAGAGVRAFRDERLALFENDSVGVSAVHGRRCLFLLEEGPQLTIAIGGVARVYSNAYRSSSIIEHDSKQRPIIVAYWWIRDLELITGFCIWLFFHKARTSPGRVSTSVRPIAGDEDLKAAWALQLASFLYIMVMIVFVLTPQWAES